MDPSEIAVREFIAKAANASVDLQAKIAGILNGDNVSVQYGIVALVLLAGNAKDSYLGKEEFVLLCRTLYEDAISQRHASIPN